MADIKSGEKKLIIQPNVVLFVIIVLGAIGFFANSKTASERAVSNQNFKQSEVVTPSPSPTLSPWEIVDPTNTSAQQPNTDPSLDNAYQYNSPHPQHYQYPSPEPIPTPVPTPNGLQGQVNCNSNYAGGYNCSDYNGNRATLNPNYAGGLHGQDSYGNQINLNPNYAGGLQGTNGSNSINCQPNYVNGFHCN